MSVGSTLGLFEFAAVSGGVGAHVTVGFVSVMHSICMCMGRDCICAGVCEGCCCVTQCH